MAVLEKNTLADIAKPIVPSVSGKPILVNISQLNRELQK
jgi:hypothetical protein